MIIPVKLFMLGQMLLQVNRPIVPLASIQLKALLACLGLWAANGQLLSRSRVAALLWPD
jgi:hypothetical protein